jgi:putative membrane protein
MIPNWLARHANENDLLEIGKAVAQAESRTAGEIVPMIVRESSFSGHVPVIMTLLWFLFFMILFPLVSVRLPGPSWAWGFAAAILSVVLGWMFARIPFVRRLVTSHHDQAQSVFHRAQLEFHETGIPMTTGKTGILIFVSLQERRAVVLGDRAISDRLKPETWVEIVNHLLENFREGKMREGFTVAIEKVGEILAREFPVQPGDVNELPNVLVVKD